MVKSKYNNMEVYSKMKKVLSLILSLTLMLSVLAAFGSLTVNAEADLTAELWTPVEIRLTSSVSYKNPYKDATIEAVFTHDDGTVIKTPGFSYDGKNEWAVRFSPTKLGNWSYSITCSDTTNASLTKTGTINAIASSKQTAIAQHGFVKIHESGRYYTYADGTPFFWLGDTNWQSPNFVSATSCNAPGCTCGSQIQHEVNDRISKGFTVYQTYFSSSGGGLWKSSYSKPNYDRFNKEIDKIFSTVNEAGMVIALGFGLHTGTPTGMQQDDLLTFVRYCIARYSCYNIVWITGQEITNTKASATKAEAGAKNADGSEKKYLTCMDVWESVGELVGQIDGYDHPNGAHMYPMKSNDSRAMELNSLDWHEAWILQGGHGNSPQTKDFYQSYYIAGGSKPFIEGEKCYEEINCGGFTGCNSPRLSAWKSILCGCCGYTYGASGVWIDSQACYGEDDSYSYDPWFTGLGKQGSFEMQYMAEFFENIAWETLVPRYSDSSYIKYADGDNDKLKEQKVLATNEAGTLAVAYFYNSSTTTFTISKMAAGTYKAYWYDVFDGKYIAINDITVGSDGKVTVPDKPNGDDWVFLITKDGLKNGYYEGKVFTDLGSGASEGTVVKPVSVTATGAYKQANAKANAKLDVMITNLYDGNTSTTWTANADRASQTFIYDLGEAKDLSFIKITPASGIKLDRKLRVYASNDLQRWTLIVNNNNRDNNYEGSAIAEKLSGGYRYVKVFLCCPDDIAEAEAKTLSAQGVKIHTNPKSASVPQYYTKLEIAEIEIFATGTSANPVEVKFVQSTATNSNGETNNGGTTVDVNTNGEITTANEEVKKSNGNGKILLIVGIVGGVVVVGAAVVIVVALKGGKKKEN